MKKRLSLIIFAVALMATLAIAASAQAYMGFDIADTTMENVYKVVGTINDTEDFRALKITLTFDNSIFVPVSKTKGTEANIAGRHC